MKRLFMILVSSSLVLTANAQLCEYVPLLPQGYSIPQQSGGLVNYIPLLPKGYSYPQSNQRRSNNTSNIIPPPEGLITNIAPTTPKLESTKQSTVVVGYTMDNLTNKLKVAKIKVASEGVYPTVVGTYDTATQSWSDGGAAASRVSSLDGGFIADKFEWKAETLSGTIYFSY